MPAYGHRACPRPYQADRLMGHLFFEFANLDEMEKVGSGGGGFGGGS